MNNCRNPALSSTCTAWPPTRLSGKGAEDHSPGSGWTLRPRHCEPSWPPCLLVSAANLQPGWGRHRAREVSPENQEKACPSFSDFAWDSVEILFSLWSRQMFITACLSWKPERRKPLSQRGRPAQPSLTNPAGSRGPHPAGPLSRRLCPSRLCPRGAGVGRRCSADPFGAWEALGWQTLIFYLKAKQTAI